MENKTLFDIYMKMDKEDLVRLLIDALHNKTIMPNQIVIRKFVLHNYLIVYLIGLRLYGIQLQLIPLVYIQMDKKVI
jgi:hypothetical protein